MGNPTGGIIVRGGSSSGDDGQADNWYFGIDIDAQIEDWFRRVYTPAFKKLYGSTSDIVVVILDHKPFREFSWRNPCVDMQHLLCTNPDSVNGHEGLIDNINGMLRFCLFNSLNSKYALSRPDLLEPGHYAREGAGEFMERVGGADGLPKGEDNWKEFCKVVKQLRALREAAAKLPLVASKLAGPDSPPGVKYLEADMVTMRARLGNTLRAADS